jgi:putative endonuclease
VRAEYNSPTTQTYNLYVRKHSFVESNTSSATQPKKAARQGLGRTGERLAAETLIEQGYRILERNFRCRHGEIDLVAEDQHDLVFVEVKTRRGNIFGRPEEAVTLHKQRKLVDVATYYLDLHACSERPWRIDVVAVQLSKVGKLEEIRIYRHAVTG